MSSPEQLQGSSRVDTQGIFRNNPRFSFLCSNLFQSHSPFSMLITHRKGDHSHTLFTLRCIDSKTSIDFRTRKAIEVWEIFEKVCMDLLLSGNGLLSKKAFAESNQRNQRHRQWNPTKLSTSCLPATGNTRTAWVLWHDNTTDNLDDTYLFSP